MSTNTARTLWTCPFDDQDYIGKSSGVHGSAMTKAIADLVANCRVRPAGGPSERMSVDIGAATIGIASHLHEPDLSPSPTPMHVRTES